MGWGRGGGAARGRPKGGIGTTCWRAKNTANKNHIVQFIYNFFHRIWRNSNLEHCQFCRKSVWGEGGKGGDRAWGEEKGTTVCGIFCAQFWGELQFTHFIVIIVVIVALETLSICIICVYYMSTWSGSINIHIHIHICISEVRVSLCVCYVCIRMEAPAPFRNHRPPTSLHPKLSIIAI